VTITDDRPDEARTPPTLTDLDGRTPDELHQIITQADAHIRELHQDDRGALRSLNDAEKSAMKLLLDVKERGLAMIEDHRAIEEVLKRRPKAVQSPMAALRGEVDPYADVRRMTVKEARDRALRVLDDRDSNMHLEDDQKAQVERHIRTDTHISRRILVTETEDYRNAFMKLSTQPQGHLYLTEDERHAIQAFNEFRAMSENTTTAGGFGIPVFIDPSIIMTAQGSGNPFLEVSRQVNVNTNQWKGVSSAGVTWTFQTEAAAATDASPSLAQPSVLVHMARGFIPYTIEVDQDYPGFASEMQTLLAEGYDELLVNKFTQGSGTGEPKGILTALSANTNVRVTIQTAGTAFSAGDPYKVWKALPQRFRRRAAWLMSVGVNNAIRQVGTANVFHAFTDNLPAEWADTLFGKTTYESPYMPDVTVSTTTPDGLAIVGDFQNFVIARRGGMSVELINNLVQQVTAGSGPAVPTGQRGWFAYARIGSNSVNDLGFRLLVNS
jgi:HK97 family phage major capsid protein